MLNATMIKKLFRCLNDELKAMGVIGEIGMCGGAVMCLVFRAREATKDIDAIFEPTKELRKASRQVAKRLGVPDDWLNDAAKAYFHVDPPREKVMELSHLRVWAPRADYMLAMKCISARFDTHDKEDVVFLLAHLKLTAAEEVFTIVERYYPHNRIPPKAKFLIEELLGNT